MIDSTNNGTAAHGGKRVGSGRPSADESSKKERKMGISVRVYPSDWERLKARGVSVQKILDVAINDELNKGEM